MNYNISIFQDRRRSKKNGLYPIKLRVYSSLSKTKKLYPLNIDLSEKDFEHIWESNVRLRGKNEELRIELEGIQSRANNEAKKINHFSFEAFEKKLFRRSADGNNVFYHFQKIIDSKNKKNNIGSSISYTYALNSLKKFVVLKTGNEPKRLLFDTISPGWLEEYEEYMLDLGKSITTVGIYCRNLRAIFNNAIEENDIHKDLYPFGKGKYQIPEGKKVKKALTQQQLSILYNAKAKTLEQQKAKDFWFFSYACNGINMKDIVLLKFSDIKDEAFHYYRAKTFKKSKQKTKIKVYLNEYAKAIIEKYGNTSSSEYVFPILDKDNSPTETHRRVKNFTKLVNQHIKKIAKDNDLPEDISTYWARHSFATNAVRKGASLEFISEALDHSDLKVTKAYFAGFEDEAKKEFAENLMDF